MLKLSSYITGLYFSMTLPALAVEEVLKNHNGEPYAHGELAHKIEEGIYEAEHASKGGLPQFEPDWFVSQAFWLIIAFSFLYFFFAKKTLPEISGVIENRKNHIQSNLESAEKLTAEADAVHDAYHENLTKSQAKAAQEIQKAEGKMKDKAASAMEDFRQKSEKLLNEAEKNIEKAKDAAMADMNLIATEAASVAVEKIIGSTDTNKVKAIVEGMNGKAKAA